MDTITHGIVGALLGKALFAGDDIPADRTKNSVPHALSSSTARVAILSCTVGSIFPDIDIFAGPLAHNPLAIMEWHRSITHSLIMLPFWAAILAAATISLGNLLKWKTPKFLYLFLIYAVGLASHIFLDLVTNFGTMIWSPVRYSRPALDWIFILDLTVTSIALVPQLAAWCYREPRQFSWRAILVWFVLSAAAYGSYLFGAATGFEFPLMTVGVVSAIFAAIIFIPSATGIGFRWTRANWARAGLAILCIYIGMAATAHHKALEDIKQFAAAKHLDVEQIAALPLPPTLTHWVGLVSTKEGVWRSTFREPRGSIERTQLYATAQPDEFIQQAKKLHDVQVYLWFARFPVWHETRTADGQTILEITDVRFFRAEVPDRPDAPKNSVRGRGVRTRSGGFAFQIIFDAGGKLISDGFKEPE